MTYLATNAPAEWPRVDADTIDEQWAQSVICVGAALKRGFEPSGRFRLSGFLQTLVLPEGILEIPIVIGDGGVTWPVFIYLHSSPEDAAHFAAVGKLLREEGHSSPVYYAPRPLGTSEADVNPLRMLTPDAFERSKTPAAGDYAMWWATADTPPSDSPLPSVASTASTTPSMAT